MSQTRHDRIFEIFRAACELSGDDLEQHLRDACGDDDELRAEVDLLLSHDHPDEAFLETPALHESTLAGTTGGSDASIPERIGEYRILSVLGRGGMGVVYLAEQETPKRTVALKVLRPDTTSEQLLSRFTHEAELLARLQHPGIAQIYEAGTADAGSGPQPFFAMEYVRGLPLLEYAEAHALSASARLRLIAQLSESLHYAHQNGVIHRDLKPANILVDEHGQPKVLDFGVARAIDADVQAMTIRTTFGELIGTVPYMSPEQASGDPREIDIRSDVYALGVVGYELLSGRLPYDLSERMIHEAVRIVREEPPMPIASIRPALRGDVATIFGKALEKDRERRYQSASEFGEDIRRTLRDEPITARPASAIYQLRKFAKRNTGLVASAAIIVLLLAGVIVTSLLAVALAHQRDEARVAQQAAERARSRTDRALEAARQETMVANAVSGFLEDVFAAGSPYVGRRDMTVAEALDLAADRVDERLADQPEVAAAVHRRLADTYYSQGNADQSIEQVRLSLERLRSTANPDPLAIAAAYGDLGQLLLERGDYEEAGEKLREALTLYDEHADEESPERIATLMNYGVLLYRLKRYDEAEPILRRSYELRSKVHGPEHPYTLIALNNLANLVRDAGRPEEAEPLMRRNMELHLRSIGEKNPNTITGIYNYADLLRGLRRFDESERYFQQSIELGRRHLPTRHWLTGLYRDGYGEMLREVGRYDEAESHLLAGYNILAEQLGPEHPKTRRAVDRLITLYEDWDRPDEAAQWRRRADEIAN
jgi:tetratricopeptide (TPR) repeat protein/predicted Ser/Thr protein kinase